ncbi:MAG: flagellar brake protein [Bacillota bacterium]
MVDIDDLKLDINQLVELEVKSGAYEGEYVCRVTDLDEEQITITLPIKEESVVPLTVGSKVSVTFSDETAKYKFETKINSRQFEDNVATCKLSYPNQFNKIQRRNFVRIPVRKEVDFRELDLDDNNNFDYNEEEQEAFRSAFTKDISGGGILLAVREFIATGSFVEVKLKIEKLSFESVIGKVIRMEKLSNHNDKIGLGLKFVNLSSSEQDELVQWVLQKQLELHKKGLL